eukprot:TRINITY_DN7756_c0_g1_i3.p1 TRINITY_DN7756_c0_g1~~TRINITY_DN7756_c0_g1_i3.p1  ORF type:complete len:361 (-),score=88.77 TRINITY_DN7756_c0_g1_i3:8-1090(-)
MREAAMVVYIASTAGKTKLNEAWCWGSNKYGQCGVGTKVPKVEVAQVNERLKKDIPVQIACGTYFTAALMEDRSVFTWGEGSSGQLGLYDQPLALSSSLLQSSTVMTLGPKKITFFDGLDYDNRVWQLSCGQAHVAAVTEQGHVYCWGGEYGGTPFGFDCLGAGLAHQQDWGQKEKPIANATMPRRVKGLNDHFIMQVACGSFHTAAITEFGQLYTWGQGSRGQLGHKNNMDQCEAKLVDSLFSNRSVLVDCGHVHTMCLLNNGDVVSFGGNSSGQLGHGDKEDESTPKLIASLTGEVIRTIACGFQHSAAVNSYTCLLYTSDAADEEDSVDLGGRRIIKKKKKQIVGVVHCRVDADGGY